MTVDIHRALVGAFIAEDFGLPIAYENMHYTPEHGEDYFALRVLQNDITAYTLAHTDESDGVFRIILRTEPGAGAIAPQVKTEQVLSAFRLGRRLVEDTTVVLVTSKQVQPGVVADGWYTTVIDVRYRAFSKR